MLPTWAIQLLFVLALIGGAYWYYTSSQAKIARLNEAVLSMELQAEINESTIKSLTEALKFNAKEYEGLLTRLRTSNDSRESIIKLFQEHDLRRLSIEKPGLIENRVNEQTRETFNRLERITTPDGM